MPFDFSTLSAELKSLETLRETMRQKLLEAYGGRQLTFFQKTHSSLWTKHLLAITDLSNGLSNVTNLAQFNRAFTSYYSSALVFQSKISFQESASLNKVEAFLRQLRRKINDGKDDLFVDVIHRLSQRRYKLSLAEASADNDDDRDAAKIKYIALDNLITQIYSAAQHSFISPMVFYVVIVQWELAGEPKNNKFLMSSPRASSMFSTTSIDMLNTLKYDLLNQAQLNEDIPLEAKDFIRKASKISSENELAQLKLFVPHLVKPVRCESVLIGNSPYDSDEYSDDEENKGCELT